MTYSLEEALGLISPKMQQNATPQKSLTLKQLSIQERRSKLINEILQQKDIQVIASELGVERTTLYRDFDGWAKTDQATHLLIEWHQQYLEMKRKNPEKAFEALTKLVSKILEKQAKVEVNVTNQTAITVTNSTVELLKQYELAIERAAQANIRFVDSGESVAKT